MCLVCDRNSQDYLWHPTEIVDRWPNDDARTQRLFLIAFNPLDMAHQQHLCVRGPLAVLQPNFLSDSDIRVFIQRRACDITPQRPIAHGLEQAACLARAVLVEQHRRHDGLGTGRGDREHR